MFLFEVDSAVTFCAVLGIIIGATKIVGIFFRHYGLPQVLGYIIAGILIGPAIFGQWCGFSLIGYLDSGYFSVFALESSSTISVFSKVGVLLLMFTAGLETDINELEHCGLNSLLIALAGVFIPFALGFLISLPFESIGLGVQNIYQCIFIGTILTATSVAITVSVLKELGKITTRLGTTIVSAAIIDDVIGIILLSIVTGMAKSGTSESLTGFAYFKTTVYGTIIMIVAFFIFAFVFGYFFAKLFRWMGKRWPHTHRLPMLSLSLCFLYSFMAEEIFGVADITGAFLAGIVLSVAHRESEFIDNQIEVLTYSIFAPVFFANIGITSISFLGLNVSILLFSLLAVFVGILGKIGGCGGMLKGLGYNTRESTIGGVGMMARGEVALIVTAAVTDTALGTNALGQEFVIMTVLLILISSILTPILLKKLYKGVA